MRLEDRIVRLLDMGRSCDSIAAELDVPVERVREIEAALLKVVRERREKEAS